jgi:hypothetical protein
VGDADFPHQRLGISTLEPPRSRTISSSLAFDPCDSSPDLSAELARRAIASVAAADAAPIAVKSTKLAIASETDHTLAPFAAAMNTK